MPGCRVSSRKAARGGSAWPAWRWVGVYLLLPLVRKTPLRVHGFEMRISPLPLTLAQLLVPVTDWMLAASVLYVLLPPDGPPYAVVLGAFLAAQMVALASHLPGGLGVFDGILALLLAPWLGADQIVAALLLYRLVYYLLPLSLALVLLVGDETRRRRGRLQQLGQSLGQHSVRLAPRILALFTFMACCCCWSRAPRRPHTNGCTGCRACSRPACSTPRVSSAASWALPCCCWRR